MKTIRFLLTAFFVVTVLSSSNADDSIDALTKRMKTAVEVKDKSALLKCFNFDGINDDVRAVIEEMADDIVGWNEAIVEVTPFEAATQKKWDQAKPDLNGRPSADISFTSTNSAKPKVYSMVAGSSSGRFLILLSNQRIGAEPQLADPVLERLIAIEERLERIEALLAGANSAPTTPEAATIQISVLGEVVRPGRYSVSPDTTLLSAIAEAGGFSQYANQKAVRIQRASGEKVKIDATKEPQTPLQKNDVITVGERIF